MIVVDNRIFTKSFCDVKIGDCIEYNGDICIKIDTADEPENVYAYTSSLFYTLGSDVQVKVLNAKVVIE